MRDVLVHRQHLTSDVTIPLLCKPHIVFSIKISIYNTIFLKYIRFIEYCIIQLFFKIIHFLIHLDISFMHLFIYANLNFDLLLGEYPKIGYTSLAPPVTTLGPQSCAEGWTLNTGTAHCYRVICTMSVQILFNIQRFQNQEPIY